MLIRLCMRCCNDPEAVQGYNSKRLPLLHANLLLMSSPRYVVQWGVCGATAGLQGPTMPPHFRDALQSVEAEFAGADVVYDVGMSEFAPHGVLVGIKQRGYDYAMMVSVAGLNPRAVRVLDVGTCCVLQWRAPM